MSKINTKAEEKSLYMEERWMYLREELKEDSSGKFTVAKQVAEQINAIHNSNHQNNIYAVY